MSEYERERDVALSAAREAGAVVMESYAQLNEGDIGEKGKNDMVTVVDHRSQAIVVQALRKAFPDDFIVAEEDLAESVNAGLDPEGERRWYIDPLDGTTNYIHAYPMFAASIALEAAGEMVMGVTFDPMRDELFHAVRGGGAYLNNEPIGVSAVSSKVRTLLATGFPFRARHYLDDYLKTFRFFFNNSRGIRRGGSAALDLAYVAIGRVDAFWEMTLSPWDMAAGVILIEEAGGRVTDFFGEKNSLDNGHIVATNGAFHDWMCENIQSVFPKGTDLIV